nr:hypothetical protein [Candidatus Freyarchaeota archaeon]
MSRERHNEFNRVVMAVFPAFRQTVEDIIAERDKVALRMMGRVTYLYGKFSGYSA